MRVEPLGFSQRDRRGTERAQRIRVEPQDRGALHEVEHAEARREARRARGRQHVVRAGDVVADRLRRVCAPRKIAPALRMRAASRSGSCVSISRCSGAIASVSATASSSAPTRMTAPKSRHEAAAIAPRGSVLSCAVDRALDGVGERRIVGDQDRLRGGVVLGLRQQVGGDPFGIGVSVGDDQHLGRAGDHVDADAAEHEALGRRHIGVARARRSWRPARCVAVP